MFPKHQYQNGLPVCLEILYKVSQNTAVQKDICIFLSLLVVLYF